MATQEDLMGIGVPAAQASRLGFSPANFTAVAGSTTASGATSIGDTKLALLTVSTTTAVAFLLKSAPPTGSFHYVTNLFASTATASVVPATGNYLNGATNTAVTLTTGQSALFFTNANGTAGAVNWYSIKSA